MNLVTQKQLLACDAQRCFSRSFPLVSPPAACKPFSSQRVTQHRSTLRTPYRCRPLTQRVSASQEDELPPWARKEKERELRSGEKPDLPFGLYLLLSAVVAIAATGSWFELSNRNAVFGVLAPDNPLWAPILGFFGVSGYPTAGLLFYKGIKAANKDFERADKLDGY